MGENSHIEWTTHTFNPWEGCQKVGPGCDHCYAEARDKRFTGGALWGPHAARRRTSPVNWRKPLAWNKAAAQAGRRDRVFCASLADVFDTHLSILPEWRADLGRLILATPHLDWLLLTKRIGNAARMLADMFPAGQPANVWIGATVVNQEEADRDIPKLLSTPAAVRFLSMEPLLGPVSLTQVRKRMGYAVNALSGTLTDYGVPFDDAAGKIHWVIVGGESGPGARPMHPDWARSLRDQCQAARVPFHFKQVGEWAWLQNPDDGEWITDAPGFCRLTPDGRRADDGWPMQKVGKARAGRLLDGRTWDEVPHG